METTTIPRLIVLSMFESALIFSMSLMNCEFGQAKFGTITFLEVWSGKFQIVILLATTPIMMMVTTTTTSKAIGPLAKDAFPSPSIVYLFVCFFACLFVCLLAFFFGLAMLQTLSRYIPPSVSRSTIQSNILGTLAVTYRPCDFGANRLLTPHPVGTLIL